MAFQLSETVDKDKVFLVKRSELERRLEPKFYTDVYLDNVKKLNTSKYALQLLWDVTQQISDGTHFTPIYTQSGVKFVSVKDVRKSEINLDGTKYISIKEADLLDKRCKPQRGDILLTKIGTVGFAAVVNSDERFQLFVSVALLRPNERVTSNFLEIYLNSNLANLQYNRVVKGSGVPDLHLEDIRKLKIPVPSLEDQNKISDRYFKSLIVSKQKEAQAQQLFDSIDTYLLNELGIELPPKAENCINQRTFIRKFSEVSGGRFDAYYYKEVFEQALRIIANGSYRYMALRDIVTDVKNGVEIRDYVESGTRYLRVTDLGKHEINLNSPRYVKTDQIPEKIKLRKESILISRSGSLGLINVVEDSIVNAILSSHIFKVDLDPTQLTPGYAVDFLRSKIGQIQLFKQNNGGVIPEINQAALGKILIPLPPLEKQNEIAAHIQGIRNQAKQLRAEAAAGLEQAKREVEAMIIGQH